MLQNRFIMICLLVMLAVICAGALALVNETTAPIIERQNELTYKRTVLDVFGIEYPLKDPDKILHIYEEAVSEHEVNGLRTFREAGTGGTAIMIQGGGFQGPISLIVSIDGNTISGFKVVSQVETPGLGARIVETGFQQSFVGKNISNGLGMIRSGEPGPSEFMAITGATETSRLLQQILNRGFIQYKGNNFGDAG